MDEQAQVAEDRWTAIHDSLELLFSKVEEIDSNQHKVEGKFDVSNKIIEQMLKDQTLMAKQIESTGQTVAQLRMDFLHAEENQSPSPTDSDTTIDNPFYTRPKVAASAPKGRSAATFRNTHTTDRANHKGFMPKNEFSQIQW
jgi:hypothetical protein